MNTVIPSLVVRPVLGRLKLEISRQFVTFPCLFDLEPDARLLPSSHSVDESQPKKQESIRSSEYVTI